MQKLDINTVAQGTKRDFKEAGNEFVLFINGSFDKPQTVASPVIFPVEQSYTIRLFGKP